MKSRYSASAPITADLSLPAWVICSVLSRLSFWMSYAVYGNILVKLDPDTGAVVHRRVLPEDPGGTGAAYNGMIVLPDGNLALKEIERGPCTSTASPPTPGRWPPCAWTPATASARAGAGR